jgi:lipopolysaccharide export system permease protein
LNYEMFVKRVQGRKLLDTQFMRKDTKTGQYDVIARAREAELRVNLPRKLLLVHMRHCFISSSDPGDVGYVEDKVWDVELPKEIVDQRRKFRPADMTWDELHQAQDEITLQLEKLDSDITLTTARVALAKPMDDLPKHLAQLRAMKHQKRLERLNLEAEVLMRPAVGLGCLCFVLVGCPVGIWFSRSDYLSAFITCFLPIVFVYYPLLLCGANLAKTGRVAPLVGVWAADVLMLLIAGVLFRRLVRN